MSRVQSCPLPEASLLEPYRARGAYADCYCTEVDGAVSQAAFVEAFYTTALFKVERRLLAWFAARPSSDRQARQLAEGGATSFAAWRVEARTADQLLLADITGRTRSWLMVMAPGGTGAGQRTRLCFGSAVVPRRGAGPGRRRMGWSFHALLGFHKLYSKLLLEAARSRVLASRQERVT